MLIKNKNQEITEETEEKIPQSTTSENNVSEDDESYPNSSTLPLQNGGNIETVADSRSHSLELNAAGKRQEMMRGRGSGRANQDWDSYPILKFP